MYSDPILIILAELRLLLTSREEHIATLRAKISELESKVMKLSEDLMKDTQNG